MSFKTYRETEETQNIASSSSKNISIFRRLVAAIASIALLLSLTMCETDYCNENMFVVGTLRAFNKESKSQIDVFMMPRERDSIGDPISFMYNSSRSYANFSLDPQHDTSRFFILSYDTVEVARIAIVHTNRTEFVNAECGLRTMSTIDTVWIERASEGDSISILMKDVDENYDNGNIEIYLAGLE